MTDLYQTELELGRHRDIVGELSELVARNPVAESLVGQLMTALYRCQRPSEALDCYTRLRSQLAEEFGSEPAGPLRQLQRDILNEDAELAPADTREPVRVPAQLPADTTAFTGREQQLRSLLDAAADSRVTVVDGMAGIGKTTLAVHAARRLAGRYPDGQLYVNLHGFTDSVPPTAPAEALSSLLESLGVPQQAIPAGVDARAAVFRSTLAGRRVLLLLDNARDESQFLPLLPGDPSCLTIVTSRRRLSRLDDIRPVSLDPLSPEQSTALFTAAAGFTALDGADKVAVDRIVELCGRLPLAIRLAASRLKNRPQWTSAYLAERLSRQEAVPELDFSQRGVSAAFESSYQDVPGEQRRLFRLLGLFPGPQFGAVTAAALLDVGEYEAEETLERLVDAHLLLTPRPGRYEFHDLLRRFAAHVLDRDEPRTSRLAARIRLLDTYRARTLESGFLIGPTFLAAVKRHEGEVPGITDVEEANAWCHDERTNITALIESCAHSDVDVALSLARGLGPHLFYNARFGELAALAQRCGELARRAADREMEAEWLNLEAMSRSHGDGGEVEQLFERSLELRRRLGNQRGQAAVLNNLGNFHKKYAKFEKATRAFEAAIELADASGAARLEGLARSNLAGMYVETERHDRLDWIGEHFAKAQRVFEELADERELARVRLHRGMARRFEGDVDGAIELHRQVAEYCRSRQEFEGEAWAHLELARDHIAARRYDPAEEHCALVDQLLDAMPDMRALQDQVRVERGITAARRGHHAAAIEMLTEVIATGAVSTDQSPIRDAHHHLAETHDSVGQPQLARHHRDEAARITKTFAW